jgi:hypothetical protein
MRSNETGWMASSMSQSPHIVVGGLTEIAAFEVR